MEYVTREEEGVHGKMVLSLSRYPGVGGVGVGHKALRVQGRFEHAVGGRLTRVQELRLTERFRDVVPPMLIYLSNSLCHALFDTFDVTDETMWLQITGTTKVAVHPRSS